MCAPSMGALQTGFKSRNRKSAHASRHSLSSTADETVKELSLEANAVRVTKRWEEG